MHYNPINIQRTLPLSRHGRHAQAPQVTLLDLGPLRHGEDGLALGSVRVCKILSLTAGTSANLSPCTTLTIFRVSLCQVGDYIRGLPDDQRFYVRFQSACSIFPLSAQGVLCSRSPPSYSSASSWQCARPVSQSLPGTLAASL